MSGIWHSVVCEVRRPNPILFSRYDIMCLFVFAYLTHTVVRLFLSLSLSLLYASHQLKPKRSLDKEISEPAVYGSTLYAQHTILGPLAFVRMSIEGGHYTRTRT